MNLCIRQGLCALLACLFAPTITAAETDIWLSRSETIDPTALPLGNGRYSDRPKTGYVYPCDPNTYSIPIGARKKGPWIHENSWDITTKERVRGVVNWPEATFTISVTNDRRVFTGNGLPVGEPTGIFPIRETDPAYEYDRNPNPIKPYEVSFSVPLNPTVADKPSCTTKSTTGITLHGIVIFSALDSQGRDEIAYEMQDLCSGMPENNGIYHLHAFSNCMPHITERNALVGYALDGFGIFSPFDENGREITSSDLDECHGMTSPIMWDGKRVTMYHYVLTRDFPYSMTCFRGTPMRLPLPSPPIVWSSPMAILHFILWKLSLLLP
jgi:hypothetical protein